MHGSGRLLGDLFYIPRAIFILSIYNYNVLNMKLCFPWSSNILTRHYIPRFSKNNSLVKRKEYWSYSYFVNKSTFSLTPGSGLRSFCFVLFLVVEQMFTGRESENKRNRIIYHLSDTLFNARIQKLKCC